MSPKRRRFALVCGVLILAGALVIADSDRRDHYDRLPALGAAVPAFDLPALGGSRLTSTSLQGHPTLLALWSTDCSASRLALEGLVGIQEAYTAQGVRVAILADDADSASLQAHMRRLGVQLPVAYASGKLNDLFDDSRRPWQKSFPLPSYLILDADGRVVGREIGVPLAEAQSGHVQLAHLRIVLDRTLPLAGI